MINKIPICLNSKGGEERQSRITTVPNGQSLRYKRCSLLYYYEFVLYALLFGRGIGGNTYAERVRHTQRIRGGMG